MTIKIVVPPEAGSGSRHFYQLSGGCNCPKCCYPDIAVAMCAKAGDDPFPFNPAVCDQLS